MPGPHECTSLLLHFLATRIESQKRHDPTQSRVRRAGRSVKEGKRGVEGLRGEGKGGRAPLLFQRVGIPPELPPTRPPPIWQALVKTIPQLLVTRQIQLPFPLWRGARARGNPDRQRHRERRREEGFFFQKGLDKCRGRSSCFAILISYEGCLAAQAHRLVSVCVFSVLQQQQQTVLQRLNEELVNMHKRETLSCAPPDALAQRAMERHGTSKMLHSYFDPVEAAHAVKPLSSKVVLFVCCKMLVSHAG